jgi:hypothetical protein
MKDPGWKPAAFEKWKKGLPEVYESFARGFEGPLGEFDKLLHGGDHRFCVPDPKEVDSFLIDTLKEFLEPQLSEGPVEITLVTGLDPGAAITILGKTFGRLPKRGAADAHEDHRKTPPIQPGLKFKKEIETADKKALLKVVYPMTDGRDTRRRALSFWTTSSTTRCASRSARSSAPPTRRACSSTPAPSSPAWARSRSSSPSIRPRPTPC